MLRQALAPILLAAALLLSACEEKKPDPKAPAPSSHANANPTSMGSSEHLRIAVVPKGTTHDFWKSIHAGAIKAARELGLSDQDITWQGPGKEDDRDQQVTLVQNLISGKYDAICLAPLDDKALVAPVKMATAAKIPVVIIDSGLQAEAGKDYVSFVATDNKKGGSLAGQRLGELMGGKGKALLLRYQEGSASTALREEGFLEAIAQFKDIQVIDPHRYAGPTRATAQDAADNLLAANADIQGIFCPNESSTFGMLQSVRSRGMAGKAKFVGFDSSDAMVDALKKGEIDALILQNPMRMGYLGVKTAVDHIRGKPVELRIDTGVGLIDKSNMDSPESAELLKPNLAEYLGGK